MPTYYDILQLSPAASSAEIEAAIDASYNQSRQLVTHPDPTTRARAEDSLRSLETVRSTLLDANRRAAYDAGIGAGAAGGLADPTAAPSFMPPPPPPHRPTPQQAAQPANAWQCPACHTVNPNGTAHCQHCGRKLAQSCARCGQLAPVSARFCGNCGADLAAARVERDRKLAEEEEIRRQNEIAYLENQIATLQGRIDLINRVGGKLNVGGILGRVGGKHGNKIGFGDAVLAEFQVKLIESKEKLQRLRES